MKNILRGKRFIGQQTPSIQNSFLISSYSSKAVFRPFTIPEISIKSKEIFRDKIETRFYRYRNGFNRSIDVFGVLAAGIAMTVATSDDDKDSKQIHGPPTVNDIKSALQWMHEYHLHPQPEFFVDALSLLFDSIVTWPEKDRSAMYLRLVGMMSELFTDNPTKVRTWYFDLVHRLTNREAVPYVWWALVVAGIDETTDIVKMQLKKQFSGANDSSIQNAYDQYQENLRIQTFMYPGNTIALLIGKFHATGGTPYLLKVLDYYSVAFRRLQNQFPQVNISDLLLQMTDNEIQLFERTTRDLVEIARDRVGRGIMLKWEDREEGRLFKEALAAAIQHVKDNRSWKISKDFQ